MYRGKSGFTLVEMLVVIGIIAVLAAILFPVFSAARKSAHKARCVSNMRQILQAHKMYSDDHDRTIVPARAGVAPGTLGYTWCILLQPYMKNENILTCAADENPGKATNSTDLPHSYGINYSLAFNTAFAGAPFVMSMSSINRTSDLLLFFELKASAQAMGASYTSHRLSRVDPRHNERAVFGFLDGHAKLMLPTETEKPLNMWLP